MQHEYYTVIENPHYFKKAQKLLTATQMKTVVDTVAGNPMIGEVMAGTGGVRKFRYAANEGRGKSGGARVIYLAVTRSGNVHLLDIFGKNEKANLTEAEKRDIATVAKLIKGESE